MLKKSDRERRDYLLAVRLSDREIALVRKASGDYVLASWVRAAVLKAARKAIAAMKSEK